MFGTIIELPQVKIRLNEKVILNNSHLKCCVNLKEQNEDGDNVVVVQRVLHADSLKDFFFRSGIGSDGEDHKLSKSRSFWKLIDDGEKAARK